MRSFVAALALVLAASICVSAGVTNVPYGTVSGTWSVSFQEVDYTHTSQGQVSTFVYNVTVSQDLGALTLSFPDCVTLTLAPQSSDWEVVSSSSFQYFVGFSAGTSQQVRISFVGMVGAASTVGGSFTVQGDFNNMQVTSTSATSGPCCNSCSTPTYDCSVLASSQAGPFQCNDAALTAGSYVGPVINGVVPTQSKFVVNPQQCPFNSLVSNLYRFDVSAQVGVKAFTVCSLDVQITDSQLPTFNTPAGFQSYVSLSCNAQVPDWPVVSASDACGTVSIKNCSETTNGTCANNQFVIRTWTATDECGNSACMTQTIALIDNEAPVVHNNPGTFPAAQCAGPSDETALFPTPNVTATDGCSGAVLTASPTCHRNPGNCPNTYSYDCTWQFADACGNQAWAHSHHSVIDTVAPSVQFASLPANSVQSDAGHITTTFDCADPNINTLPVVQWQDSCNQASWVTLAVSASTFSQTNRTGTDCSYSFVRTWTACDYCGNTATINQVVNVQDTSPATFNWAAMGVSAITSGASTTYECNALPAIPTVVASDNCQSNLTATASNVFTTGACPSSTTNVITLTVGDHCNAAQTITYTQIGHDTHFTTIVPSSLPSQTSFQCAWQVPTASQDASQLVAVSPPDAFCAQCSCGGTPNVTQTVPTGSCSNKQTFSRSYYILNCPQNVDPNPPTLTFTVNDNQAPSFTVPAGQTFQCPSNWVDTFSDLSATDNCDNTTTAVKKPVTGTPATQADRCSYTLTYSWVATDSCGNPSTQSSTVVVRDTTKPTAIVPADCQLSCTDNVTTACPASLTTVADNCQSDFAAPTWTSSLSAKVYTVTPSCNAYSQVRTYVVTDFCGNTQTYTQNIVVTDTSAPTFQQNGVAVVSGVQPASACAVPASPCSISPFLSNGQAVNNWLYYPGSTGSLFGVPNGCTRTPNYSPPNDSNNNQWYQANFNSSSWANGAIPFGSGILCPTQLAPYLLSGVSFATQWTPCSTLFLRKSFDLTVPQLSALAAGNLYIDFVVDNDLNALYINGQAVPYNNATRDGCGGVTALLSVQVPSSMTLQLSGNILAVQAGDRGGQTAFTAAIGVRSAGQAPSNTICQSPSSNVVAVDTCSAVNTTIQFVTSPRAVQGNCVQQGGNWVFQTATQTWTAVDSCGNSNSLVYTYPVTDNFAPTFKTLTPVVTQTCTATASQAITWTEFCSLPYSTSAVQTTLAAACTSSSLATYNVTQTATGYCGQSATASYQIQLSTPTLSFAAPTLAPRNCVLGYAGGDRSRTVSATDSCGNTYVASWLSDGPNVPTYPGSSQACQNIAYSFNRTYRTAPNPQTCATASATTLITVVDPSPPTFDAYTGAKSFQCAANVQAGPASATDSCGTVSTVSAATVTVLPNTKTCFNRYKGGFMWTATDACGLQQNLTVTYTVNDTTAPTVAFVNTNTPVAPVYSCPSQDSVPSVTASDNCAGANYSYTSSQNNNGEPAYCNTVITRQWTPTDVCGNTGTPLTQTVTIQASGTFTWNFPAGSPARGASVSSDCTLPTINLPTSVTDGCGNTVSYTKSIPTLNACPAATYTVQFVATDACGNKDTYGYTITVTNAPDLSVSWNTPNGQAPAAASETCGVATPLYVATVTDHCGMTVTANNNFPSRPSTGCVDVYSFSNTWSFSTVCNKTYSWSQSITGTHATAPSLSALTSTSKQCTANAASTPTSTDMCGRVVTPQQVSGSPATSVAIASCPSIAYAVNYTWVASDICGLSSTAVTQIQTSTDGAAPVITAPANGAYSNQCSAKPAQAFTVSTSCDQPYFNCASLDNSCVSPTFSDATTACPHAFVRTWSVSAYDTCGESSSASYTDSYSWTQAPTTSATDVAPTYQCADAPNAPSFVDGCGVGTTTDPKSDGTFTPNPAVNLTQWPNCAAGSFQRTWTSSDVCGVTGSFVQTVTIADSAQPALCSSLLSAAKDVTVPCGRLPPVVASCATGACSGVTVQYSEQVTQNISCCEYTLTRTWTPYSACGVAGASHTQTINVVNDIPPILTTSNSQQSCTNLNLPSTPAQAGVTANKAPLAEGFCVTSDVTVDSCSPSGPVSRLMVGSTVWNVAAVAQGGVSNTVMLEYADYLNSAGAAIQNGQGVLNVSLTNGAQQAQLHLALDALAASQPAVPIVAQTLQSQCYGSIVQPAGWNFYGSASGTFTVNGGASQPVSLAPNSYLQQGGGASGLSIGLGLAAHLVVGSDSAVLTLGLDAEVAHASANADGGACVFDHALYPQLDACDCALTPFLNNTVYTNNCQYGGSVTQQWCVTAPGNGPTVCGNVNIQITDDQMPVSSVNYNGLSMSGQTFQCANSAYPVTLPTVSWSHPCSSDVFGSDNGVLNGTVAGPTEVGTPSGTYAGAVECSVTHTVQWTATDACGKQGTPVSWQYTNLATNPPSLTVQDSSFVSTQCVVTPASPATASDACSGASLPVSGVPSSTPLNVNCQYQYNTTYSYSVQDGCGNQASTSYTVQVFDNTAPMWTQTVSNLTYAACAPNSFDSNAVISWSENCASNIASVNVVPSAPVYVNYACSASIYSQTFTSTATDYCGNSNSTSFTVTFADTEAPTWPNLPAGAVFNNATNQYELYTSVNCLADTAADQATYMSWASDNCAVASVSYSATPAAAQCGNYTVTRTYVAHDCVGHASVPFVIFESVVIPSGPVFNDATPVSTSTCNNIQPVESRCASAVCDGVNMQFNQETTYAQPGNQQCNQFTIVRNWTINDWSGSCQPFPAVTSSYTIAINDQTGPVISTSLPAYASQSCINPQTWDLIASVSATDDCNGNIPVTPATVVPTALCGDSTGLLVNKSYTFQVSDACGNPSNQITLWRATVDDQQPVVTVSGAPQTAQCRASVTTPSGSASRPCFPSSSHAVTGVAVGPSYYAGAQCAHLYNDAYTYDYTDSCNGQAATTQYWHVNYTNSMPPTFNRGDDVACANHAFFLLDSTCVPPAVTFECSEAQVLHTPTCNDACGDSCTVGDVIVSANYNEDACGNNYMYNRSWVATDCQGLTSTFVQVVTVHDTTAPTLSTAAPANGFATCNTIPAPASVCFSDNCNGVNETFSWTSSKTGQCDNYVLSYAYQATDCSGHQSQVVSYTVTVQDTVGPVFTPAQPSSDPAPIYCALRNATLAAFVAPTAKDDCHYDTAVTDVSGSWSSCLGNSKDTKSFTTADACGNPSTWTQVFTFYDNVGPSITAPGPQTKECDAYVQNGINYNVPATPGATDDCSTATVAMAQSYPSSSCDLSNPSVCKDQCVLTYQWIATDDCGNSNSASTTTTLTDSNKPVTVGYQGPTSYTCTTVPAQQPDLTFTDSCSGIASYNKWANSTQAGPCMSDYTLTWNWQACDHCGQCNLVSATITVTVDSPPTMDWVGTVAPAPTSSATCTAPAAATFTCHSDCNAVVVNTTTSTSTPTCPFSYTTTYTYTCVDSCGNAATNSPYTQTITVSDGAAPTFDSAAPGPETYSCAIPASDVQATLTATGSCEASVSVNATSSVGSQTCASSYVVTRQWVATDSCGLTSTTTQAITVQDLTGPTISGSHFCYTAPSPFQTVVFSNASTNGYLFTYSDNCVATLSIVNITSDQGAAMGTNDHDASYDASTDTITLSTATPANGPRTWHIWAQVSDGCNAPAYAQVQVTVNLGLEASESCTYLDGCGTFCPGFIEESYCDPLLMSNITISSAGVTQVSAGVTTYAYTVDASQFALAGAGFSVQINVDLSVMSLVAVSTESFTIGASGATILNGITFTNLTDGASFWFTVAGQQTAGTVYYVAGNLGDSHSSFAGQAQCSSSPAAVAGPVKRLSGPAMVADVSGKVLVTGVYGVESAALGGLSYPLAFVPVALLSTGAGQVVSSQVSWAVTDSQGNFAFYAAPGQATVRQVQLLSEGSLDLSARSSAFFLFNMNYNSAIVNQPRFGPPTAAAATGANIYLGFANPNPSNPSEVVYPINNPSKPASLNFLGTAKSVAWWQFNWALPQVAQSAVPEKTTPEAQSTRALYEQVKHAVYQACPSSALTAEINTQSNFVNHFFSNDRSNADLWAALANRFSGRFIAEPYDLIGDIYLQFALSVRCQAAPTARQQQIASQLLSLINGANDVLPNL